MTAKTTSPWTAGRKSSVAAAPKVLCVGGRCTWSVSGEAGDWLKKTGAQLKSLRRSVRAR